MRPIYDEKGAVVQIQATSRDVSEKMAMTEEQAQQLISVFDSRFRAMYHTALPEKSRRVWGYIQSNPQLSEFCKLPFFELCNVLINSIYLFHIY